ncbi:MAG: glycosyltransferase family 2 protein [Pseudomonadota bacterium]|nr:glycosyltransferase family 2 protein [Pseudomonadota bacterium]
MSSPHVVILLATYQGAPHLPVQLESLIGQTHRNWSLIVSDDGSTDGTVQILDNFRQRMPVGRVTRLSGPSLGATQNFLSLLQHVPDGAMAAFCDQDDMWFPDKLSRAVAALSSCTGPAHYAARTIIADQNLKPLAPSRHFPRPLGLRNAMVQAIMAGNTSVFSAAAVKLLQQAVPHAQGAGIISHDWWCYQVMAAFGAHLVHDPRPVLFYRQHSRSEVGRNDTMSARMARLRKLLAGEFGWWMRANLHSLEPLAPLMPADSRHVIEQAEIMLDASGPRAFQAMRRGGFYRQTRAATAALAISALSGALRRDPSTTR